MNDDEKLPLQPEEPADDDLRYAPPTDDAPEAEIEPDDLDVIDEAEPTAAEQAFTLPEMSDDSIMNIDAALAAVSALDDMLAEREAAEQAVIAKAEADAQAAAERKARLEHPEMFFPIPPQIKFQRGQMASVVPALLLMLIGAWLTFTMTTSDVPPDSGLIVAVIIAAVVIVMAALWLSSGGWARGGLFFAVTALASGGILFFLSQPASPGANGWPLLLIAPGVGFIVSGLLARPADRKLLLPGLLLVAAALAGMVATSGFITAPLLTTIGSLWPLALLAAVIILLLPVIFRQRG